MSTEAMLALWQDSSKSDTSVRRRVSRACSVRRPLARTMGSAHGCGLAMPRRLAGASPAPVTASDGPGIEPCWHCGNGLPVQFIPKVPDSARRRRMILPDDALRSAVCTAIPAFNATASAISIRNITKHLRSSRVDTDYRGGAAPITLLQTREVSIFAVVQRHIRDY